MRQLTPANDGLHAGRDAYVAGRDQHFYGVDGPPFAVEPYRRASAPELAELIELRAQPSKLLNARRQVIPFTGRVLELDEIRTWRDGPGRHGVWLIHAAGGQGKTRLANQAAEEAVDAGWAVTVARHRSENPGFGQPMAVADEQPLLMVVDYAERWPQHDLHTLLHRHSGRAGQLRMLLLSRSIDWWAPFDAECDDLGISARSPRELPALAGPEADRRVLFEAACRRFAEVYRLTERRTLEPAGRLTDHLYGLTLGLHMAALAAVDAQANSQEPPQRSADLSQYLLDRERRYWSRLYGEDATTTTARIVFIAGLCGPQRPADARDMLVRTGLPEAAQLSAQRLLDRHARCYPPADADSALEPLYPDRLTEDFIALTLTGGAFGGHTDPWSTELITTTTVDEQRITRHHPGPLFKRDGAHRPPRHVGRALTFLAAAATRWDHVAERLRNLLNADPALAVDAGSTALLAVTPHLEADLARAITFHLPERSIDLDPASAVLTERLVALTTAGAAANEQAELHVILSCRLSNAGRHTEAVVAARKATDLYRRMAELHPDTYLPHLAGSLNNLGVFVSNLGRYEEALGLTREAATIYGQLTETDPAAHARNFAASLNNLGTRLADLGRREEALTPTQQAVNIQRYLAKTNPTIPQLPDLAGALDNLGTCLAALGHPEEALAATQEAVTYFRQLVEIDPPAHLPSLALSLSNLGNLLAALGRREDALSQTQEAVHLRRQLAETNPAAYLPDLAGSLTNLGIRLSELKRCEEALTPTQQAMHIRRQLAETNPAAHLPDLARSLTNLGVFLWQVGRYEEALTPMKEATTALRRLAETNPAAYLPDLAISLSNLGLGLARGSPRQKAVVAAQEALMLSQQLAQTNQAAHLPGLAQTLWAHARVCLMTSQNLRTALTHIDDAIGIYQRLATRLPASFDHPLWSACHTRADVLDALGRHDEASELRRNLTSSGEV
ncbi:tetratricopeptide repeat protein [Micromonospora sp. NPDC047753]|uniref:tetratricopeptide repeat protein n=1 Tax=Micromonospora sp. NPDC047753 TaxID=3154817 RepID=UPI00340FF94E